MKVPSGSREEVTVMPATTVIEEAAQFLKTASRSSDPHVRLAEAYRVECLLARNRQSPRAQRYYRRALEIEAEAYSAILSEKQPLLAQLVGRFHLRQVRRKLARA